MSRTEANVFDYVPSALECVKCPWAFSLAACAQTRPDGETDDGRYESSAEDQSYPDTANGSTILQSKSGLGTLATARLLQEQQQVDVQVDGLPVAPYWRSI